MADTGRVFELLNALQRVVEVGGSDLHLKVPSQPLIRVHGRLEPIPGSDTLKPDETEAVLREMVTDPKKLDEFEQENEIDFSYGVPGYGRFRVNAFVQRGSISLVCRSIPHKVQSLEELGLPPVISEIAVTLRVPSLMRDC